MQTLTPSQEQDVQQRLGQFNRYAVVKFTDMPVVKTTGCSRASVIHTTGDLQQAIRVCADCWKHMGENSAMVYVNPLSGINDLSHSWHKVKNIDAAIRALLLSPTLV